MSSKSYVDFDLLILRSQDAYAARVVNSPAGQATIDFTIPFSECELRGILSLSGRIRHLRPADAGENLPALDPKTLGQRLFDAVFRDEVERCLVRSLDKARDQGIGLRLRLRLAADVSELADLPWEYLYDASRNHFFCLSDQTPIVRYLELPEPEAPLVVEPPLRILVILSDPSDSEPRLQVEQEWDRLQSALDDLKTAGRVILERLPHATLVALQERLQRDPIHILHFIGHGQFDPERETGVLLLEDEHGRGQLVSADALKTLLYDHRSLRLAFLNSCEGARMAKSNPFAGIAQSLVRNGLPAVIAMQFAVTDTAAITLAHSFYRALAVDYPVDAALAEARKRIYVQDKGIEWGTPVLYMRSPDGRIFALRKRRSPAWLAYAIAGAIALVMGLGIWLRLYILSPEPTRPTPAGSTSIVNAVTSTPTGPNHTIPLNVGIAQFVNCATDELAAGLVAEIEKSASILPRVQLALLDPIAEQRVAREQSGRDLVIWGRCLDETRLLLSFEILNPIGPEEVYQPTSVSITTSATVLDRADRMSRALMLYGLADTDAATQSFLALENEATDASERAPLSFMRATSQLFQEHYDKAAATFSALSQQDLLQEEALLNLGVAQSNQAIAKLTEEKTAAGRQRAREQNQTAAENFTKVISATATSELRALAFVNRSATRYLWGGDLDAARADCQQAINLTNAPSGYLCRAIVSITQLEEVKCTKPQLFEDARADLAAGQDSHSLDWGLWAGHLAWLQLNCNTGGPDAEKYKLEAQQLYAHYLDLAHAEPIQLVTDRFFMDHAHIELSAMSN